MKHYTKILNEDTPQIKIYNHRETSQKELVHHRIVTEIFNTKV